MCYFNAVVCLSPLWLSKKKQQQKNRKMLTTSKLSCELLVTKALSGWALHVNMRVITVEFFKHYVSCYHVGADSFVAEGSCLGVADFCKDPHTLRETCCLPSSTPPQGHLCEGPHPWCPAAGNRALWSSGSPGRDREPQPQAWGCSPGQH